MTAPQSGSRSRTPDDAFQKWARAYERFAAEGTELLWPSETVVRLFKGNYVPGLPKDFRGKKLLDVGFGNGNNLIFYASLGVDLAGVEVDEGICARVRDRMATLGHKADLRRGTNRELPFETGSFDFVTSWNVIHYENNDSDMRAAITEHARVLKPGGRLFVSTTGPEHKILQGARRVSLHRYQIGREDDFRKGQVFFYFDTPEAIHEYFGRDFRDVMVGRTHDHLLTDTLDWFIVTGVR